MQLVATGEGTERSELMLQKQFPKVQVLRVDRDSTQVRGHMQQVFDTANSGVPCILIGTQMLAKGHHFDRVTLVVVVDGDSGLLSPDFRAGERMGQLLTQVAGRSGRSDLPNDTTLVVHLRLGDTLDSATAAPNVNKDERSAGQRLWEEGGPIAHDGTQYCKPQRYYESLLRIVTDTKTNITKMVLVGNVYHQPLAGVSEEAAHRSSREYMATAVDFFQTAGLEVAERRDRLPDDDLVYMASASWFVPGGGGYGALVGQLVGLMGGAVARETGGGARGTQLRWERGGRYPF